MLVSLNVDILEFVNVNKLKAESTDDHVYSK